MTKVVHIDYKDGANDVAKKIFDIQDIHIYLTETESPTSPLAFTSINLGVYRTL